MFKIYPRRLIRSIGLIGLYSVVSFFSLYTAYAVRFDGVIPDQYKSQFFKVVAWFAMAQVVILYLFSQTNVILSYFSLVDLRAILFANSLSSVFLFSVAASSDSRIPRGVLVLFFLINTVGICSVRIAMRYWVEIRFRNQSPIGNSGREARNVAVFGAGDAGARLVRELLSKPAIRLKPICFFDDDPIKWGQMLHGVPIIGKPELMLKTPWRNDLRKLIIAAPSASPSRVGDVARIASEIGVNCDTLPGLDQLVDGVVKFSQLRPVRIDDLLRRPAILLDHGSIESGIQGKVILVTGAGGSIGSELCRQILKLRPKQLILLDRSEVQLFQIEQELLEMLGGSLLTAMIADVTDAGRIREVFTRYRPDVIYHAAAHKHVPMMESQPCEAIRNNALGTANLARVAHECGISRFILISTDKAINPTNVMGASKRLAEIFLQAFQAAHPSPTRFMAVRFGNVLGSSGSVVPIFQKQIAAGGPITVTHPDVTRYFMTIPEAVGLVLQAGALGEGGEIFVLDMGEPVKIVELARQMIELSGYKPWDDIEIRFVGLRPGEKMFEELSHQKEQLTRTEHSKIFRFVCFPSPLESVEQHFEFLRSHLDTAEPAEMKRAIRVMVPEYRPFLQ
jgi:FlaA1/EpsC-like NDP-sugar epimerase